MPMKKRDSPLMAFSVFPQKNKEQFPALYSYVLDIPLKGNR